MKIKKISISLPPFLTHLCQALQEAGGRALLVGGAVRDALLGIPLKDYDLEVYGLSVEKLRSILQNWGEVHEVGAAFGVFKMQAQGLELDISLPRLDSKISSGHRGFRIDVDPSLDFTEASRRRDLTINSLGYHPLKEEIWDAHGGLQDLQNKILRAVDAKHFGEDPLRVLRVAQFSARFEMHADRELIQLSSLCNLNELPQERIFIEFQKLFLKGIIPSLGLEFLKEAKLLTFFPHWRELFPRPHPQTALMEDSPIWKLTLLGLDLAAKTYHSPNKSWPLPTPALNPFSYEDILDNQLPLMFSLLGRYWNQTQSSLKFFLEKLKAPHFLCRQVEVLGENQNFPLDLTKDSSLRQLVRQLESCSLSPQTFFIFRIIDFACRQDKPYPAELMDKWRNQIELLQLTRGALPPLIQGRHLLQMGLHPGKNFKTILQFCLQLQDELGITDQGELLGLAQKKKPSLFETKKSFHQT